MSQRRHYSLLQLQLGASFVGAVASAAGAVLFAAISLLLSFVALLVARVMRSDALWWDARAVAETLRSASWRYMMRLTPFERTADTAQEERFLSQVVEALRARPAILPALESRRDQSQWEITPAMRAIHEHSLEERRALYTAQRVEDQRRWYGSKARFHDRAREAYFVCAIVAQLGAVIVAFVQWRPSGLNVVPLLVALSASFTAWSHAKRHEESAQAYALARQELDLMAIHIQAAHNEQAFCAAVTETETAISREHTMWMARRNRC